MITGEKVRLRAVERSDLPKMCQWLNDEEVMYYWGHPGSTTSLAEVERWFNEGLERSRQDRKTYIIETLDGEKEYWDKGYGTDAIMAFLNYLFNELQLHRVWLGTESYNARAQRCYEKCGFIREGVEREAAFVKGEYHDGISMSILRREFDQRAQRPQQG